MLCIFQLYGLFIIKVIKFLIYFTREFGKILINFHKIVKLKLFEF
jgi:hypothetical protein